jgi:hypothetical protein
MHVPPSRDVGHGRYQINLITDVASDKGVSMITCSRSDRFLVFARLRWLVLVIASASEIGTG